MDEIARGHVAVGRVLGAWGLRGDLMVEPLAPAENLSPGRTVWLQGKPISIERRRTRGRFVYLKLEGIDDRQAATALRDSYLQVPEGELGPLEEGQYYRFQLLGMQVRATDGRDLGRVTGVLSTADSDVFVVNGPAGEVLLPAVDDIVQDVDLSARRITVEIVPGLLPPAAESPRSQPRSQRRKDRRPPAAR